MNDKQYCGNSEADINSYSYSNNNKWISLNSLNSSYQPFRPAQGSYFLPKYLYYSDVYSSR